MMRKLTKSKLNDLNLVTAVNTWATSLVKYSASFADWRKAELAKLDGRIK